MTIKLLDRVATLLKADAHGIVESLEERSLLLKQYVREAEIDLNQKRARAEALRDEEKRLREALARAEEEIRALDEDIALALAGGKDDLARFAIRRLLPRRSEVKALAAEIESRNAELRALEERLLKQQKQFEELRARVRAELALGAEAGAASPFRAEARVADEEVELELMRRQAAEGRKPS
ncbi:MAG: PspA/IM30 family protein [Candidatus Binatia bacterium]